MRGLIRQLIQSTAEPLYRHSSRTHDLNLVSFQALRQGEHVILAYSGGVASGAMLALVAEGVREGTTKKLRFRPGAFIHIDETSLMSTTANEGAEENVR